MAQFQVRTGPIQNDAASFSPEMAQGQIPLRARFPFKTQHPAQSLYPITNAQAPFGIDMVVGSNTGNRLNQPNRQVSSVFVDFPVQMTPEMWSGNIPVQPRLFRAPRIPLPYPPVDNTTAPFSVEMVAGWQPLQPRITLGPRIGGPLFDPSGAAPFSIEMAQGSNVLNRLQKLHLQPSPGFIDFPPQMTPEMWSGSIPLRPRLFQAPRIPLPPFPIQNNAAPFSIEMTQGWHADRSRLFKPTVYHFAMDYTTIIPVVQATSIQQITMGIVNELGISTFLDSSMGLI